MKCWLTCFYLVSDFWSFLKSNSENHFQNCTFFARLPANRINWIYSAQFHPNLMTVQLETVLFWNEPHFLIFSLNFDQWTLLWYKDFEDNLVLMEDDNWRLCWRWWWCYWRWCQRGIAQCLLASGKVKVVVPVFLPLLLLTKIALKFNLIN